MGQVDTRVSVDLAEKLERLLVGLIHTEMKE